jgi:hypothetical protein
MKLDLKSWLTGCILGVCGKPLPIVAKKEPTAYSYNGVVLPKLPEWDKTEYPYAFIADNKSGAVYTLYVSTELWVDRGYSGIWHGGSSTAGNAIAFHINDDGSGWQDGKDISSTQSSGGLGSPPIWTNVDMYYKDGTLSLEASDPIPVYE